MMSRVFCFSTITGGMAAELYACYSLRLTFLKYLAEVTL